MVNMQVTENIFICEWLIELSSQEEIVTYFTPNSDMLTATFLFLEARSISKKFHDLS